MPSKAKSQSQYRFFRGVQSGRIKAPGLSAEEAGEMVGHQSPKGLPEKAAGRKAQRQRQAKRGKKKSGVASY
jgi:hypothetical protein